MVIIVTAVTRPKNSLMNRVNPEIKTPKKGGHKMVKVMKEKTTCRQADGKIVRITLFSEKLAQCVYANSCL